MKSIEKLLLLITILISTLFRLDAHEINKITSYNIDTDTAEEKSFDNIHTHTGSGFVMSLSNGSALVLDIEQKIYIADMGWESFRENPEAFKKSSRVLFYDGRKITKTEIVDCHENGKRIVFDTYGNVADNHNYFYKGVLVHNCTTGYDYATGDRVPYKIDCGSSSCSSSSSYVPPAGGGGGGSGTPAEPPVPPPPTPEETAAAAALTAGSDAAVGEARDAAAGYAPLLARATQNSISGNQSAQNARRALTGGDPVLLPSGNFKLDEEDMAIREDLFNFERTYVSETRTQGSLGSYWVSCLDTRIIRGTTPGNPQALARIQGYINSLSQNYTDAENLSDAHPVFLPVTERISGQLSEARTLFMQTFMYDLRIAIRAAILHSLNAHVLFPDTPTEYETTGNETLVLIDETGNPVTFLPSSIPGVWNPNDPVLGGSTRLVSRNGTGADGRAGFTLYSKGGVIKEFSGDGLLETVSDRNGAKLVFNRDPGNGRLQSIQKDALQYLIDYQGNGLIRAVTGPENRNVVFRYTGNTLTAVTDTDGDTTGYEYENGRMSRIVKSDGSFIALVYAYSPRLNKYVVLSTTNEEGYTEQFEYYPEQGCTAHTDQSLIVTKYWYDTSHRIIRREEADGTVRTYRYNQVTALLDEESADGSTIAYQRDSRGNITKALYGDGSSEDWVWNDLDLRVFWKDRDGVETRWTYDRRGNCLTVQRGVNLIFSGTYDERGRLVTGQKGSLAPEVFSYDANGYIASKTVQAGEQTITEKWTHDAFGRKLTYTDGLNRNWTFSRSLKTVTELTPASLERTQTYNGRKDLVSITERDTLTGEKRSKAIVWDKRHLPVKITDGEGRETLFTYRGDGRLSSITEGKWKSEYSYDVSGRPAQIVKGMEGSTETSIEAYRYRKTAGGSEKTIMTGAGQYTLFSYDEWMRLTSVTDPSGNVTERFLLSGGLPEREQTEFGGWYESRYDSSGRLVGIGKVNEKALTITYNSDGSVRSQTNRNDEVTLFTYEGRGLPASVDSPSGAKRYFYDAAGRIIREEEGEYFTTREYSSGERSVTVTDGGLYPAVWTMNAWGEVTSKTDGEGAVFRWTYYKNGNVHTSSDGYGSETRYTWNELDRIDTVTFPDGTMERREYGILGQLTKVFDDNGIKWEGVYDQGGRLMRETGRLGLDKSYLYDSLDRIVEVKSGGRITERYSYSDRGRTVTEFDGNGKAYIYQKDEFGLPVSETNRLGDTRRFEYDPEDRLVSETRFSGKSVLTEFRDGEGSVATRYGDGADTKIVRDKGGQIIRAEGSTGTISYYRDAGGRLSRQTDEGAGETTLYRYDRAGRRIQMNSGNREVHYQWGKNGELLQIEDIRQRMSVSFSYDAMGRETSRLFGNGVRQDTMYDRIGRTVMIREISPLRVLLRAQAYVYDAQGRCEYIVDEKGSVTGYEYDEESRLESVTYPFSEEKFAADKLEAGETGLPFTLDKGRPERFDSDAAVLIRAAADLISPGRGIQVPDTHTAWKETFTYDANGNRTAKESPAGKLTYQYDDENRLLAMGNAAFSWDRDGNLLCEKSLQKSAMYEYTDTNRMKTSIVTALIEKSTVVSVYAYDAFGRRTLVKDEGGETMRTVYDGLTFDIIRQNPSFADGSFTSAGLTGSSGADGSSSRPLPNEGDRYRWINPGSGNDSANPFGNSAGDSRYRLPDNSASALISTRYTGLQTPLYANGEQIAMNRSGSFGSEMSASGPGGTAYLGRDILGSMRSATDEYGRLEDLYDYDAFGTPFRGDFNSGLNAGYTGKPFDPATGMYNYGFRDYAAQTARFTTSDPIRDGLNWFVYAGNDPVNFVDEWGLSVSDRNSAADARSMEAVAKTYRESNAQLNLKVAQNATSFVGSTYYLGGEKPSNEGGNGIDCSSCALISGERASGTGLADRTANSMLKDPNLLVAGDGKAGSLNFYDWDGDNKYEHVTVVGENNKEIHPSSNSGTIKLVENGSLDQYAENTVNKNYNWDYILGD